ncbi:MAG: D-alanyl-D-alanine carboxypeptidase family protein [Parachlamydiales bacterium]
MRFLFIGLFFYISSVFSNPLELDINAKNAILINAKNNQVVFNKNAFDKAYPASLTKVITIWYVLEKYSDLLDKTFIASSTALKTIDPQEKKLSNYSLPPYTLESDGSSFDVILGEKLRLKDLLLGMMLPSGNDAANVVAESLGGSIDSFIKDMNIFVSNNNIKATTLFNPHGLHFPEHATTANDLAQITRKALENPKFLEIFSCKAFVRPRTNKQQRREITTFNRLLKPGKNYYEYAIGGKTGYHEKAKYNLLSVAKCGDRTLIAVVMGCKNSEQRYEDTKKLFDAAFQEKMITKKLVEKEKVYSAKIPGGSKILKAKMQNDLILEYYPSEETPYNVTIFWDDVSLPIKKDQKLASMIIKTADGEEIKTEGLYAVDNVKKSLFYIIRNLFSKG